MIQYNVNKSLTVCPSPTCQRSPECSPYRIILEAKTCMTKLIDHRITSPSYQVSLYSVEISILNTHNRDCEV